MGLAQSGLGCPAGTFGPVSWAGTSPRAICYLGPVVMDVAPQCMRAEIIRNPRGPLVLVAAHVELSRLYHAGSPLKNF